MRIMRTVAALGCVALAACAPENQGSAAGGLVTEADSLRCGATSTLYTNHTAAPKDLHVRVSYDCMSDDTLRPATGRLVVLDAQNRVVQNQDQALTAGTTHRGTFTVTAGARLVLECRGFSVGIGCRWSYSYAP